MKIRLLGFCALCCLAPLPAAARPMVGISSGGTSQFLLQFDSATPGTVSSSVPITGLVSGDVIQGIDFRPVYGVLYALGINNTAGDDTGRIYTIDITTAVATLVGANPFSTALMDGAAYGIDFNPTSDRIRIVNSLDQSMRVNPDTGALVQFDTTLTPASATIVGAAYDRNDRNPVTTLTTLFGIDSVANTLVRIGGVDGTPSPNAGAVTTIGPLGVTLSNANAGFDIAEDGVAYASLATIIAGTTTYRLYTVNLTTGAVTAVANIGTGITTIRGIAAVPSAATNLNSGEFFPTIQAAINDAQTLSGHTIVVNAGSFGELVTVNKSVTLQGARAGVPGFSAARGTFESVVRGANPAGGRTTAFNVTADNVTIDGFTVQEAANPNQFGAGIVLAPNIAGTKIRNNVIQNNIAGLFISNDTASNPLIVEFNLFKNNNLPGSLSGTAIYTDQVFAGPTLTGVVIDNNSFEGNQNVGVLFGSATPGSQSNAIISNNIFETNGNAILLFNLSGAFVTGNFLGASAGSQFVIGGGVSDLNVSENFFDGGAARGIRIGDFGGGGTNQNIIIGGNSFVANATAGLEIHSAAGSYTGTLIAQSNWWGNATGPMIASNPGGTGQKLVDPAAQVSFQPFLSSGLDQSGLLGFQCYPPPVLYGINSANNNLIRFSSTSPGAVSSTPITGLIGGDTIIGLDFRPATGELFGLGSGSRLYVINPATGVAAQRGSSSAFALTGNGFGFDFNPVVDRIRVTSDSNQNIRLNPNDGTLFVTDTALAYAAGDPNAGFQPDAGGVACLNNFFGATRTTLYDIDTAQNVLVRQGSFGGTSTSPNTGQLFTQGSLGINPSDGALNAQNAFDISSPVPGVNLPFAALTTTGTGSLLYSINLITGNANFLGTIGGGSPLLVRALTVAPTGDFAFSAPAYSVGESGPVASITIFRLRGTEGSATIQFTTSDGTAVAGPDYTDSDQPVTFGSGETSKVVTIPITNDSNDEFNETILMALSGAFNSSQATAVLTISDDDVATPTLAVQASPPVAVGEAIFNTASITGNAVTPPGGTLTFQLFGPNDSNCSGAIIFTSTVPVNGDGNYLSSSFTPTTPGAYNWVVIYSGDGTHNSAVTTACGGPTQSVTATNTVLGNIATRLRVETGDNALIAGFFITGTQPKKVIVRGIGGSLSLADKLEDPTLELRDSMGALVDANDNWQDSPNKQATIDSALAPANDLESAIVATLPANGSGYTAILRGANNTTGIGVVEAYDVNRLVDSELANISTRGFVSTGDNVLIAGTIVAGKNPQNVIVRAIGPSLDLQGKMEDPTLELHDRNGALVDSNDNWMDSPNKQAIIDSTVAPTNALESAIVATLSGNDSGYTAIVRGVNGTTGIAVVELFALP